MNPYYALTYAALAAAAYWLMRRYMPSVSPRERLAWAIGWPVTVLLLVFVFVLLLVMDDELESEARREADKQ